MRRIASGNRFAALLGLLALAMSLAHIHETPHQGQEARGHGVDHEADARANRGHSGHAVDSIRASNEVAARSQPAPTVSEDADHHEHSALPDFPGVDCYASCRNATEDGLAGPHAASLFDDPVRGTLPGRFDRRGAAPFRGLPPSRGPPASALS